MAKNLMVLDEDATANSIADLKLCLTIALDLVKQLKQVHWNVTGLNFVTLHCLFDEFPKEMQEHVSVLAERIAALDRTADGNEQNLASQTPPKKHPTNVRDEAYRLNAVTEKFVFFGRAVMSAQLRALENGDEETADILAGISIAVDQSLWFLNTQLE